MTDEADGWSASTLSVRETLREAIESEEPTADTSAVVATVTGVKGSAYRRPGAKRVLGEDAAVEAITAGDLDGPVADLAERAIADGAVRETFDLTSEDDTWGFGLGCNGVIDVLVEPADESFRSALARVAAEERVAIVTFVGGDHPDKSGDGTVPVGARAIVGEDGEVLSGGPRASLPEDLLAVVCESESGSDRKSASESPSESDRKSASEFAAVGRSDTLEVETDRGTAEIFVDGIEPVPELLVFGHGEDVRPVARLAREAGFRVTVACSRGARADAERFPAAHEVVATRPPEIAETVSRPADTYAVLMSHTFVDDRLALESLLETDVPYIGLMGPRKRFEEMRVDRGDGDDDGLGIELSADDVDRIATPVGLDLGGGEPTQIALSVVSEALAVSNDRAGGRLTDGEKPIHPRSGLESVDSEPSRSEPSRSE